ncbi:restriction endonuclease subunit S [Treponema phagedenis]|uniref:restriction endonuclease subunit S n=1 Tax=Treponema phagedenis TaxID=162 RepID=UPI0011EBD83D|nr:restriction endonuclease subunit S [Treponema phagedenis]TYT76398.1 restriction endonuclease subunit S [Treponema phagedenis]TYT76588.1 restriction endonuclease subunit S [Treponema phagedenis]
MEKLEKEFLENGGEWKEVIIGDIFEKLSTKFLGKGDKFKSASKVKTEEYNVPLVYAKSGDNGIMYWAKKGDFETHSNVISIIYNGAIAAGLVYAQPQETGILAESYLIKLKDYEVDFKVNLFLKNVLEKVLYPKYSREHLATWGKVKTDEILLPFLNGKINFSYMEKFIEELEAERIEELEAYLIATGLKDYKLTKEDQKILDDFEKMSDNSLDRQTDRQTDKIRLGNIFNIESPKKKFNANSIKFDGEYPYVARGETNNGIKGYITEEIDYLNNGNTISFGQDTATMFYQKTPYFTGDKIKILSPKIHSLDSDIALYYITATKKTLSTFSWGSTSYNVNNLENIIIELPIEDNKIDITFMKKFIKVVKKLIIKDVVIWADKKIEATKKVALQN